MKLPLSKYHGLGNDFLLANYSDLIDLNEKERIDLIQKACSRQAGIGADGFILVKEDPLEMIYYNQDGSRADMCGNGLRCFARYVKEEGLVNSPDFTVQTLAGEKTVHIHDQAFQQIELELGEPDLSLEKLALADPLKAQGLPRENGLAWISLHAFQEKERKNNGKEEEKEEKREEKERDWARLYLLYMNTIHAVLFKDELEKQSQTSQDRLDILDFNSQQDRKKLGEYYANVNAELLKGTNINFVQILDEHTIALQTYERGCGFTLACGTGAAASAFAACALKGCKSPLTVKLALGELVISIRDGKVILCGPAVRIMKGEFYYE